MEKVMIQEMGGGIFEIKPEGRESKPRRAYGIDEACLIVGGLAKAGFDVSEAEQQLVQACLSKVERVRALTEPREVVGA